MKDCTFDFANSILPGCPITIDGKRKIVVDVDDCESVGGPVYVFTDDFCIYYMKGVRHKGTSFRAERGWLIEDGDE